MSIDDQLSKAGQRINVELERIRFRNLRRPDSACGRLRR